jgi:hypothetical protein
VSTGSGGVDAVSFVVVVGSASPEALGDALESVLDQRVPGEVVLVGDAPTDVAAGALPCRSAPDVAAALRGAAHPLVCLLRGRDELLPRAVAMAVAARRAGAADIVVGPACLVDRGGALRGLAEDPPGAPRQPSGALLARPATGWSLGNDGPGPADLDAAWRTLLATSVVVEVEEPLAAVRVDEPDGGGARTVWPRVRARLAGARRAVAARAARPTTGWDIAGTGSYDATSSLPDGAERELTVDNPRLVELGRRYAASGSPRCAQTFWADEYRTRDLDLRYFRGDNAFVWQHRNLPGEAALRYSLYSRYVASFDRRGWVRGLGEDGAFGCWVHRGADGLPVSRDLLDSVNELHALDRRWGIAEREGLVVLDIGAGYGRLAHRAAAALPGLRRYYCTDGVAESTFLSEYYLGHRGVGVATVVPADEVDQLPAGEIDVAVNVHSFSEMGLDAIDAWVALLADLRVPRLLLVPNDPEELLSYERDHSRRPFVHALVRHGYEQVAKEPVIAPGYLRRLVGIRDNFYFFENNRFRR